MRYIKDSQNFLHSRKLVNKLIAQSNITKEDTVLEIGPGKGIITEALDRVAKEVIAVELDEKLFNNLKIKDWHNTKFLNLDFLNYKFDKKVKIFSNIPFNMTTDILSVITKNFEYIEDFYLIMQKEAAGRFIGAPYQPESLRSLLLKPIYDGKVVYRFNNTDFSPVPNVDIVLVHFHKKKILDVKNTLVYDYWNFVAYMYNAHGRIFDEKTSQLFSHEQQKRLRKSINIDKYSIISTWNYEQWLGMFNCYNQYVEGQKKNLITGALKRQNIKESKLQKEYRNRKRK